MWHTAYSFRFHPSTEPMVHGRSVTSRACCRAIGVALAIIVFLWSLSRVNHSSLVVCTKGAAILIQLRAFLFQRRSTMLRHNHPNGCILLSEPPMYLHWSGILHVLRICHGKPLCWATFPTIGTRHNALPLRATDKKIIRSFFLQQLTLMSWF